MRDDEVLARIHELVDRERELRAAVEQDRITPEQEREQVARLEVALDQCWDLLRQRRARRDAGEDPDAASLRPSEEVEGYRQ
jgi:Protein of unknown function (DUF2630)